jgi:hypothetical protein
VKEGKLGAAELLDCKGEITKGRRREVSLSLGLSGRNQKSIHSLFEPLLYFGQNPVFTSGISLSARPRFSSSSSKAPDANAKPTERSLERETSDQTGTAH